jgi:hypothetical protein
MLSLGRLVPPDPPEKWRTVKAALDSDDKSSRLIRISGLTRFNVLLASVVVVAAVVGIILAAKFAGL